MYRDFSKLTELTADELDEMRSTLQDAVVCVILEAGSLSYLDDPRYRKLSGQVAVVEDELFSRLS